MIISFLECPLDIKIDERIVTARVQKAALRLNRIETLPVGQKHLCRLTQTYVLPLVYACEYVPYLPICYDLDKRIKDLVWGKARVSANMYAAKAYALPAHNLFIEGQRVIRCFRAVWRMANRNVPRQHYMTLWLAPQVARREGAWYQFLGILEEWGACLRDDGGIQVAWKQVVLHLNQDYRSWMHNTRLALRLWNLGRARGQNPRTYDMEVAEVDVQVMSVFRNPGQAEQTVLANGVNSKTRSSRHFGVPVSALCEHGCDNQDDMFHRVYKCKATAFLRERHGIGPDMVMLVEASCQATQKCCLWEVPAVAQGLHAGT